MIQEVKISSEKSFTAFKKKKTNALGKEHGCGGHFPSMRYVFQSLPTMTSTRFTSSKKRNCLK